MTTIDLDKLKVQLTGEEGRRSRPYDDATSKPITQGTTVRGHVSFGIGHNCDTAPICDAAIDAQYLYDVAVHSADLDRALPWWRQLDDPRARALLDLMFNEGLTHLLGFHDALAYMQQGLYNKAAEAVLDSNAARQLPSRYQAIASLLANGE